MWKTTKTILMATIVIMPIYLMLGAATFIFVAILSIGGGESFTSIVTQQNFIATLLIIGVVIPLCLATYGVYTGKITEKDL